MIKRVAGQIFFILLSSTIIIIAGGGMGFLHRPVGVVYLILWAIWFLITALGRQLGRGSTYEQKRGVLITMAMLAIVVLITVPPWEYSHFNGPIPRDGSLAWIGLLLFAAGIILQLIAMWALRGFYTILLAVEPEQPLVTTGPYRIVRHPGYLSYIISLTGIGLALSSLIELALTVLVVLFLVWRIGQEEKMLLVEFGEEYKNYTRQTRWRLIPLIY